MNLTDLADWQEFGFGLPAAECLLGSAFEARSECPNWHLADDPFRSTDRPKAEVRLTRRLGNASPRVWARS